eukprot:2620396-Amphidinium_carterae.1
MQYTRVTNYCSQGSSLIRRAFFGRIVVLETACEVAFVQQAPAVEMENYKYHSDDIIETLEHSAACIIDHQDLRNAMEGNRESPRGPTP